VKYKANTVIRTLIVVLTLGLLAAQSACGTAVTPAPKTTDLIFRNWEGDIAPEILAAFETQYGIKVHYSPTKPKSKR